MPVQLNGATSGSVTIQATAVAGSSVLTLPAVTDTVATKTNPTFIGTVTAPTLVANTVTVTNAIDMGSSFMRNRIINGAMQVDQRNAGASAANIVGTAYTVDRWSCITTQSSKGTWGQNLNSVTTTAGFPNYLGFQSSSAYSLLAADYFLFSQSIEGFNFADLGFGTASAQTVTISFRVYSSLTGTFGGVLKNYAATRNYPFTYLINTANTWTSISVTIPGDTGGTWVGSTSAGAVSLFFGFGVGSTYSGTAGSWSATNYLSATGAVSVVGTLNATFYITGVQLEPGSVATPFERLMYSDVLAKCQRYYTKTYKDSVKPGVSTSEGNIGNLLNNGGQGYINWLLPVEMRSSPSVTVYNPSTGGTGTWMDSGAGYPTTVVNTIGPRSILYYVSGGPYNGLVYGQSTASAEL